MGKHERAGVCRIALWQNHQSHQPTADAVDGKIFPESAHCREAQTLERECLTASYRLLSDTLGHADA